MHHAQLDLMFRLTNLGILVRAIKLLKYSLHFAKFDKEFFNFGDGVDFFIQADESDVNEITLWRVP